MKRETDMIQFKKHFIWVISWFQGWDPSFFFFFFWCLRTEFVRCARTHTHTHTHTSGNNWIFWSKQHFLMKEPRSKTSIYRHKTWSLSHKCPDLKWNSAIVCSRWVNRNQVAGRINPWVCKGCVKDLTDVSFCCFQVSILY